LREKKDSIYYGVRDDGSYEFSDWETSSVAKHYDSPYSYSRDGGYAIDMYYNLGYDTKLEYLDEVEDETHFVSPQLNKRDLIKRSLYMQIYLLYN
jgi:hypothetical protein